MTLPAALQDPVQQIFSFAQVTRKFTADKLKMDLEPGFMQAESDSIGAARTQLASEEGALDNELAALQTRHAQLDAEQTALIIRTNTHNANPPSPFNWPAVIAYNAEKAALDAAWQVFIPKGQQWERDWADYNRRKAAHDSKTDETNARQQALDLRRDAYYAWLNNTAGYDVAIIQGLHAIADYYAPLIANGHAWDEHVLGQKDLAQFSSSRADLEAAIRDAIINSDHIGAIEQHPRKQYAIFYQNSTDIYVAAGMSISDSGTVYRPRNKFKEFDKKQTKWGKDLP